MNRLATVTGLLTLLALGGCVVQPANPYPPPPPLQTEVVPAPPSAVMVWEPGHYQWNGVAYVWVGGRYVPRQAAMHRWEHGHWVLRGGGWVWVPGHWV